MTPDASVGLAAADLSRFSAASHDVNPLHRSDSYARRTAFGERVVFRVLGALAALARLGPRPGRVLAALSVEFAGPMFVGVDYAVDLDESSPDRAKVKLRDGRRVVLRLTARFRDGAVDAAPAWPALPPPRTVAADHADAALVAGLSLRGRHSAEPGALAALLADFGKLSMALTTTVAGVASARGKITAFARRELSPAEADAVEAAVGRSDRLLGRVALVTGASRGLGAAIAHALALQGCTVIGTYLSQGGVARALADARGSACVSHTGGSVPSRESAPEKVPRWTPYPPEGEGHHRRAGLQGAERSVA